MRGNWEGLLPATIRGKLYALSAGALLATVVVGGAGYHGAVETGERLGEVFMMGSALRNHLEGDMMHDALRADLLSALAAQQPAERLEARAQAAEHGKWFRSAMDRNNALPLPQEAKKALAASGVKLEEYIRKTEDLVSLSMENPQAVRARMGEFTAAFEALETENEKVSDLLQSISARAEQQARSSVRNAVAVMAGAFLFAGLVVVALSRATIVAITRPVDALVRRMRMVAGGDLRSQPGVECRGELEDMAMAVESAIESMRRTVETIIGSTSSIHAASQEMQRISEEISSGASETAAQARVVSDAGDSVSSRISTVAASGTEMFASIREISTQTASAASIAAQAASVAESAGELFGRMEQTSSEIGDVVRLIQSVADQTNLLALNAAIEAARAGAAGNGFAVVAKEVKALASQTSGATQDVTERIRQMQNRTAESVAAIQRIREAVTTINDVSSAIATAVEQQTTVTRGMEEHLADASASTSQIASSAAAFADTAHMTSENANRSVSASQQLIQIAGGLQESVAGFRLA